MTSKFAAALVAASLALAPLAALAQPTDIVTIISGIGDSQYMGFVSMVSRSASVRVEKLSSFAGAKENANRLVQIETLRDRRIGQLQRALIRNPTAVTAIRNAGFEVTQIVSLHVSGDGAAILYADDL